MAHIVLSNRKFVDRGYTYQKPTVEECREMGWTECAAPYEPWGPYAVNEVIKWVYDHVWWQDYVYKDGRIFFKHEKDSVFFMLRWS